MKLNLKTGSRIVLTGSCFACLALFFAILAGMFRHAPSLALAAEEPRPTPVRPRVSVLPRDRNKPVPESTDRVPRTVRASDLLATNSADLSKLSRWHVEYNKEADLYKIAGGGVFTHNLIRLTTPISAIVSIAPRDPFPFPSYAEQPREHDPWRAMHNDSAPPVIYDPFASPSSSASIAALSRPNSSTQAVEVSLDERQFSATDGLTAKVDDRTFAEQFADEIPSPLQHPTGYTDPAAALAAGRPIISVVNRIALVHVWVATNRKRTYAETEPRFMFTNMRDDSLNYAICSVYLPLLADYEDLPGSNIPQSEYDPSKHVLIAALSDRTDQQFYNLPPGEPLVFVHGYNVSFPDAVLRTAQLAFDTWLSGRTAVIPVCFSWNAESTPWGDLERKSATIDSMLRNGIVKYVDDRERSGFAAVYLVEFLRRLSASMRAANTRGIIMTHSTGGYVLTVAAQSMLLESPPPEPIPLQPVLFAPDLEPLEPPENFSRLFTPFTPTIFSSRKDRALGISRTLRVQREHPLLGQDSGGQCCCLPGFTDYRLIDATDVHKGVFGHFYYSHSREVLQCFVRVISLGDSEAQPDGITPPPLEETLVNSICNGRHKLYKLLPRKPEPRK